MDAVEQIPRLVAQLYRVVNELEELFPDRPFTPDGHLVGSIGEVLAQYHYDLELLPCSTPCHDARTGDGRLVQIKATQGTYVGLREAPDYLLVLQLTDSGAVTEIYNGPGRIAWDAATTMQRNGQRPISISKLKRLMTTVAAESRLPRMR